MRPRILQLAPLFHVISDDMTYGSIERVIRSLDQCYVNSGYFSAVSALTGSRFGGEFLPCDSLDYERQAEGALAFVKEHNVNLIHIHRRDFLFTRVFSLCDALSIPVLVTLHGPGENVVPKYRDFPMRPNVFFSGLSRSQIASFGGAMSMSACIYNGVDLGKFYISQGKGAYLLYLGRISRIKGCHTAIKVARAIGKRLVIAGVVLPEDQVYFDSQIVPYIDDRHVSFVGPVNDQDKASLLSQANVLLMPIEWDDPCPLVCLEAMASGTPVVGYNKGALPELVRQGVGGYLAQSFEDLLSAVLAAEKMDPEQCRQYVSSQFSWQRSAAQYLDLYQRIITLTTSYVDQKSSP